MFSNFYFKLETENEDSDLEFDFFEDRKSEYYLMNTESTFYEELFSFFNDEEGRYAVEFRGIKFVPNKAICIRRQISPNGTREFFLNQFGVDITPVLPDLQEPYIFKLVPRGKNSD